MPIIRQRSVDEATQRFRENLPKLVEDKRKEAVRVGEGYPSLEEICGAED
ncbi:MAG: hypothetical protein PHS06_04875 [Candidatus Shapirobacteria bacterium]|nr:hypothetical protein [Candidatus Shapirobacteria bacterium]